jgi:hypothetical protein
MRPKEVLVYVIGYGAGVVDQLIKVHRAIDNCRRTERLGVDLGGQFFPARIGVFHLRVTARLLQIAQLIAKLQRLATQLGRGEV